MSKRKRLLPWVTMIMITLFFLILVNYNTSVYLLNKEIYDIEECKVTKKAYDGLLAFFPKIEVEYTYNGEEIVSKKTIYNGIFFNEDIEDNIKIYVNKYSPTDFLVIQDYKEGWPNIVLNVNMIVCLSIFIYSLVGNIYVKVKRIREKRVTKK